MKQITALGTILLLVTNTVMAEEGDNETDLAKQLANPVAALISVPIQMNYDGNFGLTTTGQY